jgi:hypothetical protein
VHNLDSQAQNHTAMMENAPEVVAAPGCNLSSNEDVAEAEPSLADEATSDLEPAYRGNKEVCDRDLLVTHLRSSLTQHYFTVPPNNVLLSHAD